MKVRPTLSRGAVVAGAAALVLTGTTAAFAAAHWDYSEQATWNELDASYAACADGTAQSPIDITTDSTVSTPLKNIAVNWNKSVASVANNGHTVQATAPANAGTISIDGKQYALLQLHFHARSEHEVNGSTYPVEVHFVSKATDGTLAVIGVFVKQGSTDNMAWEPLVKAVSQESQSTDAAVTATINWKGLLPSNQQTFRYAGSLTTPPCTEGVRWNVMVTPVSLSARQIQAFTNAYWDNFRSTQDLNGRSVFFDSSAN